MVTRDLPRSPGQFHDVVIAPWKNLLNRIRLQFPGRRILLIFLILSLGKLMCLLTIAKTYCNIEIANMKYINIFN
jgi:hypothetical protein